MTFSAAYTDLVSKLHLCPGVEESRGAARRRLSHPGVSRRAVNGWATVPFYLASAVKGHATTWGSSLVLEEGSPVLNGDVVRRGGKEFDHSVLDSFLSIVELLASGSTIIRVVKSILVSISLGRKTSN